MKLEPVVYAVSTDGVNLCHGTVTALEQAGFKFYVIQNRNGDTINVDDDSVDALIIALQVARDQIRKINRPI